MNTQRRTADEQYQLIMECRSSGLSDYQRCTEHDINPGTFYNRVKRLRKKACYDIPPAQMPGQLNLFQLPEEEEPAPIEPEVEYLEVKAPLQR